MGAASGRFLWTSRMSRGPAATGHEPMLIEEGLHRKSVSRTWARHLRSEGAHIRRYEIRTTSLADVWNNPGQWTPTASSAHLPWPPKILADRWTPLIVRELLAGHTRFNDLHRRLPRISRSILSDRLRRLEREGIVYRRMGSNGRALAYLLTPAGREAEQVVASLREWGKRRKLRHEVSPGASVATTAVTFMTLTPKSQLRIRHPQLAE